MRVAGTIPEGSTWVYSNASSTWVVSTPSDTAASGYTTSAVPDSGGYKYNTRTIVTPPMAGGLACAPQYETKECIGTGPCQVDCEMTAWSSPSSCTKSCGVGTRFQTRTVVVDTQHAGAQCGSTTWTTDCNQYACPIDCHLQAWENWSPCSRSCASADGIAAKPTRTRVRHADQKPRFSGKPCKTQDETEYCNEGRCPIDCSFKDGGVWPTWSVCSSTTQADGTLCGYGKRSTEREIEVHPDFGGAPCGALNKTQTCYSGPCDVDCDVSEYSDWSACDAPCVPIADPATGAANNAQVGMQTRNRTIVQVQFEDGAVCPSLFEERQCNVFVCPQDCIMSSWSSWAPSIGDKNTLSRVRSIVRPSFYGGEVCADTFQTKAMPCVDNKQFGEWSACTKECGTGKKWRNRHHVYCSQQAALKYDVSFQQGVDCNTRECANGEELAHSLNHVPISGINTAQPGHWSIPALAAVDANRRLNEDGAYRTLNAAEQKAYELPAGEWKMYEKY